MKTAFLFDFETRSELDLKKVGAVKYALHPSTTPTLLIYTFGRHTAIRVWDCLREPLPHDLIDVIVSPEKFDFIAWNIFFDWNIWVHALPRVVKHLSFGKIPLSSIHDEAARSLHFRTGASLETSARLHRLPMTKDKEGHRLMLKQASPGKDGQFVKLNEMEMDSFKRYGYQDVNLLRQIHYSLPELPDSERYAFEWTFRRNVKGIRLDMPLVVLLQQLIDHVTPSQEAEFTRITGFKLKSPKLIGFFKQYYPHIESLDAENMQELYDDTRPVPAQIRRAIEIKYLIGSSSIAKLAVALRREVGGRINEVLVYHQAGTKRWAGMGIQVQNFPRPEQNPADPLAFDLNVHNLRDEVLAYALKNGLKEPVKFVRNLLRRIFIAEEGKTLCAGDFSKIEPTVLFWLVGLGALPKNWYEQLAAAIFNRTPDEIGGDSEERQIGKMGQLSCGYGAGHGTLRTQIKKGTGILVEESMAKLVVNTYRRKYPEVVNCWRDLENAFRCAIGGQSTTLFGGKVHFFRSEYAGKPLVCIRLPSGGHLYYHNARVIDSEEADEGSRNRRRANSIVYDADGGKGKVEEKKIYGGLICENVVSAIAREVMKESMFRLEMKGFDILNLVHDEIWGSFEAGREEEFAALMCQRPAWAKDLDINSGDKAGVRYLK